MELSNDGNDEDAELIKRLKIARESALKRRFEAQQIKINERKKKQAEYQRKR